MGKIVFMVSGSHMKKLSQKLKQTLERPEELEVYRATMSDALEMARTFRPADVDVIVSRGETTKLLLDAGLTIPVVDIPLQLEEVVDSIGEAKKLTGKARPVVGFLGFREIITKVQYFNRITDIHVRIYECGLQTDIRAMVQKAMADGVEAIISGPAVYEEIKDYAPVCLILESSYKSICQSYEQAQIVSKAVRGERKMREEMSVVLNSVTDAILAVDELERISMANDLAAKLFSLPPEPAENVHIADVAPEILVKWVKSLLSGGEGVVGNMLELGNKQYAITMQPTKVFEQVTGVVMTLQEVDALQKMEARVRRKVYLKGNVAKYNFTDILGESEAIKGCISSAQSYAKLKSNVLIFGETGTGKELFAQSIHNASDRNDGPFVAVNCGAIPSSLVESEFFGYVDGAFTGARKGGKMGYFELAHKGTLFLDEVSEMDPMGQIILLRALQERQIRRVGSDVVVPIDTRVIAACNANLHQRIADGKFRKDLYFRLSVLLLHLPPLNSHAEDIELIARHYVSYYSENFGKTLSLSPEAVQLLESYHWEGNVRHLRNFCERLAAITDSGVISGAQALNALSANIFLENSQADEQHVLPSTARVVVIKRRPYTEAQLRRMLTEHGGNRGEMAKTLGVSRPTLWKYLKELEI